MPIPARWRFLLPLISFGVAIFTPENLVEAAPTKPNIIVILADDMGYSDIGCYGSEISTPTLDKLATNGIRFTQFYNNARCCPSRASLITGLYPHQAGIGHMMEDRGFEGYRGNLSHKAVTIAEVLKPAGYRSYAVGKWHLTPGQSAKELTNTSNWPLQRGFDRFYGTIHGAGSFWDPSSLVRDNQLITMANDPEYRPEHYYYTDAISDTAVRFVREHGTKEPERPFFMYLAYTAAHWPMHAKESDIAKYKGKYHQGYEPIRAARWEKQKQLGVIDSQWALSPLAGDWSTVKNREFEERCMEVYAGMIDCMDQGIGRLIAQLKAQGQLENTLIFFMQDNGGCAEPIGRGTNGLAVSAKKFPSMSKDDQQLNSQPKQTRDGRQVRQGYGVMPGPEDTYVAYGRDWANVSDTPFREYKHWLHEGGISTPLIVHWPAGMAEKRRGTLEKQTGHLIDIMATCLEVSSAKYPSEFSGEKITPKQGVSLMPLFEGKKLERNNPLFFEHEGNRAVRDGQWKLVAKADKPWELYDMESDRSEMHDLADKDPAKVKAMAAQWNEFAARSNVLPLGAWKGKVAGAKTASE